MKRRIKSILNTYMVKGANVHLFMIENIVNVGNYEII